MNTFTKDRESVRPSFISTEVAVFAVLFNFFMGLGLRMQVARNAALKEMGLIPNSAKARGIVREAERYGRRTKSGAKNHLSTR